MAEKTARQKLEDFLHEETFFNGILAKIEAKTKINRIILFLGAVGTLAIWLVFGYAVNLVVNVLGFVYPAYRSAKAVETKDKIDDTKWLTYWVVFSFFTIFDFFSECILEYFPIYHLVKMMMLVWCMTDYSWSGSSLIYNKLLRPLYLRIATEESSRAECYRVPDTNEDESNPSDTSEDKKES